MNKDKSAPHQSRFLQVAVPTVVFVSAIGFIGSIVCNFLGYQEDDIPRLVVLATIPMLGVGVYSLLEMYKKQFWSFLTISGVIFLLPIILPEKFQLYMDATAISWIYFYGVLVLLRRFW